MREQQLDRLGLARVVGIADEAPKAALAQAGFLIAARFVEPPGSGFPVQIVAAVVRHHDLLAEAVVAVGAPNIPALAFAAPHPDQRQQRQQRVIQIGALAQVGGVGGYRQIVEGWDVAGRGQP